LKLGQANNGNVCYTVFHGGIILIRDDSNKVWMGWDDFECRRISMAGLSTKTIPHLADAINAAVLGLQGQS
jgi:hypothetical protein